MIHPTAIVATSAKLPSDIEVGPYSLIADNVEFGARCRVGSRSAILNNTIIKENCTIGPGTVIGSQPDSFNSHSDLGGVSVGANTTIREFVVVYQGIDRLSPTTIGNDSYLMARTLVGSSARLGQSTIIANNCSIGAQSIIEDHVFIGGSCVIKPNVRIGTQVMMRGQNAMSLDVPPFLTAYGNDRILGLNIVGLRRAALPPAARREIKQAFSALYHESQPLSEILASARRRVWTYPQTKAFWDFVATPSPCGICQKLTREEP